VKEVAMTGVFGQKATFNQENGPDIELAVFGDEWYAYYETTDGYTVVYDEQRGLFCYASVVDGGFVSTGVPASAAPPPGIAPHARESAAVRQARVRQKRAARGEPEDPRLQ
jgi:hypothetical protein